MPLLTLVRLVSFLKSIYLFIFRTLPSSFLEWLTDLNFREGHLGGVALWDFPARTLPLSSTWAVWSHCSENFMTCQGPNYVYPGYRCWLYWHLYILCSEINTSAFYTLSNLTVYILLMCFEVLDISTLLDACGFVWFWDKVLVCRP